MINVYTNKYESSSNNLIKHYPSKQLKYPTVKNNLFKSKSVSFSGNTEETKNKNNLKNYVIGGLAISACAIFLTAVLRKRNAGKLINDASKIVQESTSNALSKSNVSDSANLSEVPLNKTSQQASQLPVKKVLAEDNQSQSVIQVQEQQEKGLSKVLNEASTPAASDNKKLTECHIESLEQDTKKLVASKTEVVKPDNFKPTNLEDIDPEEAFIEVTTNHVKVTSKSKSKGKSKSVPKVSSNEITKVETEDVPKVSSKNISNGAAELVSNNTVKLNKLKNLFNAKPVLPKSIAKIIDSSKQKLASLKKKYNILAILLDDISKVMKLNKQECEEAFVKAFKPETISQVPKSFTPNMTKQEAFVEVFGPKTNKIKTPISTENLINSSVVNNDEVCFEVNIPKLHRVMNNKSANQISKQSIDNFVQNADYNSLINELCKIDALKDKKNIIRKVVPSFVDMVMANPNSSIMKNFDNQVKILSAITSTNKDFMINAAIPRLIKLSGDYNITNIDEFMILLKELSPNNIDAMFEVLLPQLANKSVNISDFVKEFPNKYKNIASNLDILADLAQYVS